MKKQLTEEYRNTVVLPEYDSGKIPPAEAEPNTRAQKKAAFKKRRFRMKKSSVSSATHMHLFLDEELAREPLDLKPDSSLDFRRMLEPCGPRYKIERLLATGGFGQVFLATDRHLGRKVVVKSLKPEFLDKDSAVRQFITEAKLCSQLRHPGIVPLYALNTDGSDGLHIAMQLIKGITLKAYLKRTLDFFRKKSPSGQFWEQALRDRLEIFIRICDAVSYCHDRSIIHNDLKPENIMIGDFSQVHVMDWGIASMAGSVSNNAIHGTICYIAPERLATKISNERTDIFALGMILNEIVTLRGPVLAENSRKVMERLCSGDFEPSTSLLPKYRIPRPLRAIIEKARNPKAAQRYRSVKALSEDVHRYLFFEETEACPDNPAMRGIRFLFQHKQFAVILVACLLLAAGVFSFFTFYRKTRDVQAMQQAMLIRQQIQSETDSRAETVGQNLRLLEEQLRNICSTLKQQMSSPSPCSGPVTAVLTEELNPRNPNRRPGLVHTAYYKNPVTLDYGSFHTFGKSIPRKKLQMYAGCFQSIQYPMLSAMFMNTVTDRSSIRNDENKIFHLRASLIHRMIFILGNDLAYTYPGIYDPARSADDLIPDYIRREFRRGRVLCWSPPYLNGAGNPIVSCWQLLYDAKGKAMGKVGFEVNFRQLLKPLLEAVKEDSVDTVTILIDTEARSIFSSYARFKHRTSDLAQHLTELAAGQVSYHYPGILQKIRQRGTPSNFIGNFGENKYRVYWKKLPCSDWLLLQHVPEK